MPGPRAGGAGGRPSCSCLLQSEDWGLGLRLEAQLAYQVAPHLGSGRPTSTLPSALRAFALVLLRPHLLGAAWRLLGREGQGLGT